MHKAFFGGEEKMKKEKSSPSKPSVLSRFGLMLGTDKFHNVMTVMCIVCGILWIVLYIICLICRDAMMSQAVSDLAQKGTDEYTLVISSPMFTVLKIFMGCLPVVSILWAVSTVRADKNRKLLCEKKLLITALVCIAVASFSAVVDLARLHMIFG